MKDRESFHKPDFSFAHREEGFDNHIENSIRGYTNLHHDVIKLSEYFVEDETDVVDIGCSTGKTIYEMMKQNSRFAPLAHYSGIEYASGFVNDMNARHRQIESEELGSVKFHNMDVRNASFANCSLVTSLFTLQFMPPRSRRDLVKKIHHGLNTGGAFIFAEKTMARDARLQEIMTFQFYDHKSEHFEADDLLSKERELRSMMKCSTWNDLHSLCMTAGFCATKIQPFWQNHLFVGAIAIK